MNELKSCSLRHVKITAPDTNPFHADIEIDGKKPYDLVSLDVRLAVDDVNRVTISFIPEVIEIEGEFEQEQA